MSMAKSAQEVRDEFLDYLRMYVEYWAHIEDKNSEERLDGLAFSVLAILDGGAGGFPAVDLVLRPHPDDKEYCEDNDEDWYVDGQVINDDFMLHELWGKRRK